MSSRICRELGVVQGFGTIEINGLHRTFHNIIKSEMFWTENLLLDYKVSLIVISFFTDFVADNSKQVFCYVYVIINASQKNQ